MALGGDLLAGEASRTQRVRVLLGRGGAGDDTPGAGTGHGTQRGARVGGHWPGGGHVDSDVADVDG